MQNYAKVKLRPSTFKTSQGFLKNHIKPQIGSIPLADCTSLDLQRFYKHLLDGGRVDRIEAKKKPKGLAPKTVRNIHQMVGSAYNLAMEQKLVSKNPTQGCALLTGSTTAKTKRSVTAQLATGEIDFAIGTHALISGGVAYADLGLVVTDEQHRFGVAQRTALAEKGEHPHTLVMSATPIPRTLALILYGDLDVSVIDQLPPGRKPIETYAVTSAYHPRLYAFIRKQVEAGRQVYIVCPMVS